MPQSGPGITLGDVRVGPSTPPYVIAEIGVNHEGSLNTAKRLIEQAREGGADAAKFQTYKADTIASKNSPAYWDLTQEPTPSQHQLFQKYDGFGEAEYLALVDHCRAVGIDFLSTPFDDGAVDFLAPLMPFFKIASADLTSVPLLRRAAAMGKPVVLSTGAATLDEITDAVAELRGHGAADIALLHCVLNYPCANENAHLNMIGGLRRAFPEMVIGYSDHTIPDETMSVTLGAYARGARIIEKHFTHDKSLPGNDHYHAMDLDDLKRMTAGLGVLAEAMGDTEKAPLASEAPARQNARRSIVLARGLKKGDVLAEGDITYKRPGTGVSPLEWDNVIGSATARDLGEDHVLQWDDLIRDNG